MNDSFWLSDAQMARIEPYFPLSHGIARVDDRRAGSAAMRWADLTWRDALIVVELFNRAVTQP